MAGSVSCFHPVACGESIGAGLYPVSCFFLLFTGKAISLRLRSNTA